MKKTMFSSASFTMTQELDTQNTRIETECLSSGKEYRAPAETCMETDLNATEATEYDLNASAGLVDDENAHKAAVDDPNTYRVVIHDVNTPKTITHTMLPSNKRRRSKRKSYFGYKNIRNNKLAYQKRVRDTKTGVKSSKTGSKMSKNDHILNAKQHMDTHCGELPQIQDQATDIDKAEQYADVEDIDKPFIEIPNKNINLGDMKAKYQCKDCKHKFKSVKAFQVHKNEDGTCKSWTCEICSKVFHSGKTNFNSHIKAHNKQHSLKCKCKRKFPNSKHLEKRLKKCALNGFAMKPFKCDKCNHSTTAEHLLHIHKLKEHNSTDGIYHCYKCPKEFVNLHSLYGHLLQVHGTGNCPERPCIICGKLFSTSCGLKRHEASHSDIKQFKCEECPRAFKTKPELIKHQKKTHLGVIPLCCELCGKCFWERRNLVEHQLTHSGEKPYACTHCEYRCAHKGSLYKHLRKCENIKKQTCEK